jgi:hypothetical protein
MAPIFFEERDSGIRNREMQLVFSFRNREPRSFEFRIETHSWKLDVGGTSEKIIIARRTSQSEGRRSNLVFTERLKVK